MKTKSKKQISLQRCIAKLYGEMQEIITCNMVSSDGFSASILRLQIRPDLYLSKFLIQHPHLLDEIGAAKAIPADPYS